MNPLSLNSYNYILPKDKIATHPLYPKENAKLLVYNRAKDSITHATFADFAEFLPQETLIIFNNTKVLPARIYGVKVLENNQIGGKIEGLFHKTISENHYLMQFRGRLKPNSFIKFENNIYAKILKENSEGIGFKEVSFFKLESTQSFKDSALIPLSSNEFFSFLEKFGHIPLPPYIKRSDTKEDKEDYQSVFAKHLGAIAAPTASLHFSKESFNKLIKNFSTAEITLHVGAGTFLSVNEEDITKHKMHQEFFKIPPQAASSTKTAAHITAIGTTSARSVEYFLRTGQTSGYCDLFLHPKNPPQFINALLTNFHLPKTTLLMLVAAFIGLEKTLELYKIAIEKNYRFYSYGDAMLIL